jgi:hypothetical protein
LGGKIENKVDKIIINTEQIGKTQRNCSKQGEKKSENHKTHKKKKSNIYMYAQIRL